MNDAELLARNSERISANTKKTTLWCLSVWNEWANEWNAATENNVDDVERFCVILKCFTF